MHKLQLIKVVNPFNRADKEISTIEYEAGQSLLDIRNEHFPKEIDVVVSLNGHIIPKESLPITFPCDRDYILFVPAVHDGGGGGKTILRAVMMIGIAVAAPYAAAGLGFVAASGALTATGMMVAGGIAVAGGLMVNMLMPPPRPKMPTMDQLGAGSTQAYSWNPQTVQQQGIVIPKFYGRVRLYGNIITAYTRWTSDINSRFKQYAYILLNLGIGPYAKLSDFEINDQPIDNFSKITVEKRMGLLDQEPVGELDSTKTEYALSMLVKHGNPVTYTTLDRDDYDGIEVDLSFLQGLFLSKDNGSLGTATVNYRVRIRKVGDIDWHICTKQAKSTQSVSSGYWSLGRKIRKSSGGKVWYEYNKDIVNDEDYEGYEGLEVQVGYDVYIWEWRKTGDKIAKDADLENQHSISANVASMVVVKVVQNIPDDKKGFHEIEVSRLTANHTDDIKYSDKMTLTTVREVFEDKFQYPRQALVAIKALATDQLSGSLRFSCLAKASIVRICTSTSPETWTAEWSDNPAWVAWDVIAQPVFDNNLAVIRYDGVDPANIDLVKWKEWADFCDQTVYDGRTKYPTTSGSTTSRIYMASGLSQYAVGDKLLIDPAGGTDYQGKDNESQVPAIQSIGANYFDVSPSLTSPPAAGIMVRKGEKRITFHGGFDSDTNVWDALLQVCAVGRAIPVWNGTKLTLAIKKQSTPVQMFTVGNIGQDSFSETFSSTEERAAEIEVDFISEDKDYARDRVSVFNKNLPTKAAKATIELFGITKASEAWRAASMRLYENQYIVRNIEHTADIDSIACVIGDQVNIQHDVPQWGYGGRLVSATSNSVTLDKSVTIEASKSYAVMVRLSDDTIVEKSVTNSPGTYTTLTVSTTFSSVPAQYDPYSFGEVTKVVKPFVVTNITRDSDQKATLEMMEYNETIWDKTDYEDPIVVQNYSSLADIMNVTNLTLKERAETDESGIVRRFILVSYDLPENSVIRSTKIYYKESDSEEWILSNSNKIRDVEPSTTYDIAVASINLFGVETPQESSASASITTSKYADGFNSQLNVGISGLQIFGQANDNEFHGRDCKFVWKHVSPFDIYAPAGIENYGAGTGQPIPWFKDYKIEIWGITQEDKAPRRTEFIPINEYIYSLEKNYEDGLVRDFEIRIWARDRFNRLSTKPAMFLVTNPSPKMLDVDGATITPTVRRLKHGNRVTWPHPYNNKGKPEYDLAAFILYCAENSGFTTNVKRFKVASMVNGFDPAGDISDVLYKVEVDGLDPKKTYYYKVVPLDAYSIVGGLPSSVISAIPGLTHDDDENDKPRPAKYNINNLVITAITEINDDGKTVTNLLVKGLKATEGDADGYILEYRAIKNLSAVSAPTGAEVDAGVSGSYAVDGDTLVIGIDGEAGTGTTDTNYFKKKVRDVKNNWKYFFRIRTQDTGGNKGEWSEWVTFSTTKANNAADTTAPDVPSLSLSAKTDCIDMIASIASPPTDLSGFQFAVKSSAFSGDESSYIHASVDAAAGKGKVSFYGSVGTTYYIKARSYDNSKNYSAWTSAQTSSPIGVSMDLLSEPFSKWLFDGTFSSTAGNKVSWTSGTMKKKKNSGATTDYSISSATDQTITGTRFICFDSAASTTVLQIYTAATYQSSDTAVGVAKVEETTGSKVNIHRLVGTDAFSLSAYEGGFNLLSAKTADLGNITTGIIKMSDSTKVRIYMDSTVNPPILRISESGYNADSETNPNNLLWSSAYNYLKVIDSGNASVTFDACDGVGGRPSPVAAGAIEEQIETVSNYGDSNKLLVFGIAYYNGPSNDFMRAMPFAICANANEYESFEIAYSPTNEDIICVRRVFNGKTSGTYDPGSRTITVNWYLMAETLS